MPAVQSPAKVYKFWAMINLRFGAGKGARKKLQDKSLPAKDKEALKYNEQTTRGVSILRDVARGGLVGAPSKIQRFQKTQALTLRYLKKYCKLIAGEKLEKSHEDSFKFRKLLKQFFLVVTGLDPAKMTAEVTSDEAEPQLDAFDDLDTSAVDQAMKDPNFTAFPDEEFTDEEGAEYSTAEGPDEEGEEDSTVSVSAPPPQDLEFKQRLQSLLARYQKALQDGASNRGQLERLMKFATAAAKAQDFEQGLLQLDKLAAELDKSTVNLSAEPEKSSDPAKLHQARLKTLLQRQNELFATNPAARGKVLPVSQWAAHLVTTGKANAAEALDKLEAALNAAKLEEAPETTELSQPTERQAQPADQDPDKGEARWLARRQTIEEPYLKALKEQPARASQLRAVLAYADGKAEAKDFGKALQGLDNLEKLLQAPTAVTDGQPAPGLVEKRKFLADRWQRIPVEVRADLHKMKEVIAREFPSEDADKLTKLTEDYLSAVWSDMKVAIDDDINAGDAQYKTAISTIGAFRDNIAKEPLIQHLKGNKLKVALTVEAILLAALAEVEKALAG